MTILESNPRQSQLEAAPAINDQELLLSQRGQKLARKLISRLVEFDDDDDLNRPFVFNVDDPDLSVVHDAMVSEVRSCTGVDVADLPDGIVLQLGNMGIFRATTEAMEYKNGKFVDSEEPFGYEYRIVVLPGEPAPWFNQR